MAEIEFTGEGGSSWQYDPDERLGKPGGFGAVYAGTDVSGNPVAVKVVEADPTVHPRLRERELDIIEKVRGQPSEHLIEVFDAAEVDGSILMVMQRAEHSLHDALTEGGLDTVDVFRQVVAGLEELHGLGIIHRDIKPKNVLSHDGVWKLADFGIARDLDMETQTYTFKYSGTPPYMAPEMWRAESPDTKTDLYSLGCLAYELVTGAPPFQGPEIHHYRDQHLHGQVPELSKEVDPGLRGVIMRLLSKNRGERYPDARAVREKLDRLSLPLSDAQKRLQMLAAAHTEERSKEEARRAALVAETRRLEELADQGLADLRELLGEGVDLIGQAGIDVGVSWANPVQARIQGRDASLQIEFFQRTGSPIENDSMLIVCEVQATSRRSGNRWTRLANLVYEAPEGIYRWFLYRFRRSGGVPPGKYSLGPPDRSHGLAEKDFMNSSERQLMLSSAMHIWELSKFQLVPKHVVNLYAEALEITNT